MAVSARAYPGVYVVGKLAAVLAALRSRGHACGQQHTCSEKKFEVTGIHNCLVLKDYIIVVQMYEKSANSSPFFLANASFLKKLCIFAV
jgi:hypothetical protein